jgi:tRNA 2-selenouridine synthase
MSLTAISPEEALQQLDRYSAVIDARSEDEYALDHLPGAINWPTLNNGQRIEVGTLYKQVNPFEARKLGAAMAARNIASHIERELMQAPRHWEPLIYCWRGGQRSGSLSLVLSNIGFKVNLIEGGYKAFRAAMLQDIARLAAHLRFRVVCGPTGSGKTRLLTALNTQGAQVMDLEALARHRSSVLGGIPGQPQPSQKHFDTLVWDSLRRFDPKRVIYVESESKKVGNVSIPTELVQAMRTSACVNLQLQDASRVALLLEDYRFMTEDVDHFCDRLAVLTPLKGGQVVQQWQALARSGNFQQVVMELLVDHYDPAYFESMGRNFPQFQQAPVLQPADHSMQAMTELARTMVEEDAQSA